MAIKDLTPRQGKADIVATVVDMGNVREFEKFGKKGRVANATIKDESGEIKLSLWNEQIEMVHVGDKVHVSNGYVNEWQGEMQLTTGKFGKLEIVGKGDAEKGDAEKGDKGSHIVTEDEKTEEESLYELKEKPPAEEEETADELEEAEDENIEEENVD